MNRHHLRIAALALFLYLSLSPDASAAPRRDRERFDPSERVVHIIKKVKNFFRDITSQDDYPLPPRP